MLQRPHNTRLRLTDIQMSLHRVSLLEPFQHVKILFQRVLERITGRNEKIDVTGKPIKDSSKKNTGRNPKRIMGKQTNIQNGHFIPPTPDDRMER